MRYSSLKYIFVIGMFFVLQSCKSNPSDPFDPQNGTFKSEQITAETATLNVHDNLLLAGTTEGAFTKQLDGNTTWHQAGLHIDSSQVIDFVVLKNKKILAVIKYDRFDPENPMLYKSENGGDSWFEDYSTNISEVKQFSISAIEKEQSNPEKLFVYRGHIIKSNDAGVNWNVSFDKGFVPEFLSVSPYHSNQIWAGGWTNIFSPYLVKSENGGETWALLNENFWSGFNTDTNIYDAILHPENSDHILVGAGGAVTSANVIRKSTDGGQSWQTVLEGYNTRTLTHSSRDPETVYASGRNGDGTLFFTASNNFGDTWQRVEWADSPAGVQVNDMVSVMENGHEVLYLGTNKGLYSYTFEE